MNTWAVRMAGVLFGSAWASILIFHLYTPQFARGMAFASAMIFTAAAIEEAGWFK